MIQAFVILVLAWMVVVAWLSSRRWQRLAARWEQIATDALQVAREANDINDELVAMRWRRK